MLPTFLAIGLVSMWLCGFAVMLWRASKHAL